MTVITDDYKMDAALLEAALAFKATGTHKWAIRPSVKFATVNDKVPTLFVTLPGRCHTAQDRADVRQAIEDLGISIHVALVGDSLK